MKKRRLWIGLLVAVIATALWWQRLQQKPPEIAAAPVVSAPFVQVAGTGLGAADRLLREKAEYFDPTPLFFPTQWNYGQAPLRAAMRRGPGQVFGLYPPLSTVSEAGIQAYAQAPRENSERLADVLAAGNQTPFGGMGRVDTPRQPLQQRSAQLEVRVLGQAEAVINRSLTGLNLERSDFAPLQCLAVVTPSGVIGELAVVNGSGFEEIDEFFRDYLLNRYRLGQRLNPGSYQIWVGP